MKLQLPRLNFPAFEFRFREINGKPHIFDPCRQKFVPLTPEEWVRQNSIAFLHQFKNVPLSMISVEKSITINSKVLRYDLVVFSKSANPILLVECKAPEITLSEATFDQIAVYNMLLNVPFLYVTNGISHYFCRTDAQNQKVLLISELPDYQSMISGS